MLLMPYTLYIMLIHYIILSVCVQLPDATPEQIKKAYYNCMKSCHPDLSGNDPDTTNFCMFINEVYTVSLQVSPCIGAHPSMNHKFWLLLT